MAAGVSRNVDERTVKLVRFPPAILDMIGIVATKNQRSVNAEILFALTAYYEGRPISPHELNTVRSVIKTLAT